MNYKQLLIDSQKSGVSALLEFVLQYHQFDKVVANFVEGKDFSYYRSRVSENTDSTNDILFYPCNGKKEVELVRNMVDSNLHLKSDVKVLYFCDNDYGLIDKKEGIFYTDYYSVENYYTTEDFIKKVLNNVFNINKFNPEYNICLNLYKNKYENYHNEIVKVNAYCYGIRVFEQKYQKNRTNLSVLKLKKFVENNNFEEFKMKDLNFNNIKSMFSHEINISNDEYNEYLKIIDNTNLRGKWELEFVIWFLEGLREEIKNGNSGLSKNNKKVISFQNDIMTSMEKYACTTNSLIAYIKENT